MSTQTFATDHTPVESLGQPYAYPPKREFYEPDWTRIHGWKNVTREEWEDAMWQRKNTVKSLKELKELLGAKLPDDLAESLQKDIETRATMSLLVPPQMINTMNIDDLWNDPVRRYMLPAFADRRTDWPNHPKARDRKSVV